MTNASTTTTPPANRLLGHWPLDERDGSTAHDRSGNGRHGTCKGAVFGEHDGRAGAYFNGNGSFIEVPHSSGLEIEADITIAAWLWKDSPNDGARWDAILSKTPGVWDYELLTSMAKSDQIAFFSKPCTPEEIYSDEPVPARRWTHVAVTRRESTATFYLDCIAIATVQMAGTYPRGRGVLQIGHDGDHETKNGGMLGWISGVALYDRCLTPDEVAALAQ